jgi:hypothetical protein
VDKPVKDSEEVWVRDWREFWAAADQSLPEIAVNC